MPSGLPLAYWEPWGSSTWVGGSRLSLLCLPPLTVFTLQGLHGPYPSASLKRGQQEEKLTKDRRLDSGWGRARASGLQTTSRQTPGPTPVLEEEKIFEKTSFE